MCIRDSQLDPGQPEADGMRAEVEAQLAPIAARFADNDYYSRVTLDEIRADEDRQRELQTQLEAALRGWEQAAHELEALAEP